jgi:hypothetical protein
MTTNTDRIRALNDELRQFLLGGMAVITPGIAAVVARGPPSPDNLPYRRFPGPNRTRLAEAGMTAPLGLLGRRQGSLYSTHLGLNRQILVSKAGNWRS